MELQKKITKGCCACRMGSAQFVKDTKDIKGWPSIIVTAPEKFVVCFACSAIGVLDDSLIQHGGSDAQQNT